MATRDDDKPVRSFGDAAYDTQRVREEMRPKGGTPGGEQVERIRRETETNRERARREIQRLNEARTRARGGGSSNSGGNGGQRGGDPADVPIGTGLADRAKGAIQDRQRRQREAFTQKVD